MVSSNLRWSVISSRLCCIPNLRPHQTYNQIAGGGIGIHKGLKILRLLTCEFESPQAPFCGHDPLVTGGLNRMLGVGKSYCPDHFFLLGG